MAFSTVLHEYEVLVCSSLYNVQCPWQFMSSCLGCGNYTCYYHVASCLHDRHIRTLRLFQRELHIPCVLLIWLWVQITTHSTERNPVDYHCLLDHARYVGSLRRMTPTTAPWSQRQRRKYSNIFAQSRQQEK